MTKTIVTKTIVNEQRYKPTSAHKTFTLTVEAMCDMFPGAWHEPEDLMKWIAQHSYVQSVTLNDPAPRQFREEIKGC